MISKTAAQPTVNKKRQFLWRATSVVFTFGMLIYLLQQVEWDEFGALISQIPFISMIAVFVLYYALNWIRAIRFRTLLGREDTSLRILIPITLYHNFLVRVLPFKLGEISYVVLLRTHLNYSMQSGVSSLVGARAMELIVIVIVFTFGIASSGGQLAEQRDILAILTVSILFASIFGLYFAGTIIRASTGALELIVRKALRRELSLVSSICAKFNRVGSEFDAIRKPRLFTKALFLSIFTYSTSFIGNYILLHAVGIDADFSAMAVIISIGMFAAAFPFSISGFGVVEFGWAFAVINFASATQSEAASIGFVLHGFQIIAASLLGLIGYFLIPSLKSK